MATNYAVEQISSFVRSARMFGYDGEIWLGVLRNDLSKLRIFAFANRLRLLAVDVHESDAIFVARYRYYNAWAEALDENDWILTADIRDSFIQRNPFSDEFMKNITRPVNLFFEYVEPLIGSDGTNIQWLESCWGSRCMASIASNPIICGGNIMGTVPGMVFMFRQILALARTVPHCANLHGVDQAMVNWLYHINGWKDNDTMVKVWTQGEGPVNTLSHVTPRVDRYNLVLNNDGSLSALVHQYDRHGHIEEAYKKLLTY